MTAESNKTTNKDQKLHSKEFISNWSDKIDRLENSIRLDWWNLATTSDEKYGKSLQEKQLKLRKELSSKEDCDFLSKNIKTIDPSLARQATLLLDLFKENQTSQQLIDQIVPLETSIEEIYTSFRPTLNGRSLNNNEIKQILRNSSDQEERQKAWEGSKKIGEEVEQKVRLLIQLRNEAAKQAGFPDFYSMKLELQELNQTRLFELIEKLYQETNESWHKYKKQLDEKLAKQHGISSNELKPWHYHDPFFQEIPSEENGLEEAYEGKDLVAISKQFYSNIGLPIDDVLDRSDLFEREKKNQHAFCTCIDHRQDIRVLCNMRDNEYWMATLLHELGHAAYDKFIDQQLPFLVREPAHISSTEAIAMLFGRLAKNGDFLKTYCGVSETKAKEFQLQSKKQIAIGLMIFARWTFVMIHFERAMYQQPELDLNQFWWDCVEKFQGIRRVPNRNKPDWASKLHLACAPVYYQNYLIGEMMTSQLMHYLEEHVKKNNEDFMTSPQVGKWLIERLFRFGKTKPWEQALEAATGEKLNPKYFAKDVII